MIKIKHRKLISIAALCLSFAMFTNGGTAQAADFSSGEVVTLINQSRAEAGVGSLDNDSKLAQAARLKANDMFARQYFAHVGPDGNGPAYWFDQAGYDWYALGENIAYGYNTAQSVHAGFMASSGHRANILGADYEDVGVAAVSGQFGGRTVIMVVEEFGATNSDTDHNTNPVPTPTPKYVLNVTNGSGSGSYESGKTVSITANAPVAGKIFDRWTGDNADVSDVYSSAATVKVPSHSISLTATYKSISTIPTTYALNVTNGAGSGSYASGQRINITANAPSSGKVFDRWTGDTSGIANVNSVSTAITMPSSAVNLTASYKDAAARHYLTVNNGNGDGWYAAGTNVTVTADAPAADKVFARWTGNARFVSDINSATTTLTMPSRNVSINAKYKKLKAGATASQNRYDDVSQKLQSIRTSLSGCF